MDNQFGKMLVEIECRQARKAVIDVMDSALLVMTWMEDNGVEFTASDLLGFTKLILAQEKQ